MVYLNEKAMILGLTVQLHCGHHNGGGYLIIGGKERGRGVGGGGL